MLRTETTDEAERLMTICNACRYCEGICAVFPAMEMRNAFSAGDLGYLANLCHNCGACYHDCQYAPPHPFEVNVPKTMARLRRESYEAYAWPAFLGPLFRNNGLAVCVLTGFGFALVLAATLMVSDPSALFRSHSGTGSFYAIMPHDVMAGLFGAVFVLALLALAMGVRNFWRSTGEGSSIASDPPSLGQALKDTFTLKYLDGGGGGCTVQPDDTPSPWRKRFHHFTFYGFLLCFAATSVGTVYHYGFGWVAPYGYLSLPNILGTLGGIGLVVGPVGLYAMKRRMNEDMAELSNRGMDMGFLALLFLTGLSGLLLMVFRETAALGTLLVLHLGFVMGLFLAFPYGKFVHGIYRFAALVRYAMERRGTAARAAPAE